ncbi:YARHG domain-containing protein [Enterococcus avium]|nr:YARHG domain-containing protein [Enterococcus avium]
MYDKKITRNYYRNLHSFIWGDALLKEFFQRSCWYP